jgi:hypothetical protein
MIDFERSRLTAFEAITEIERVNILSQRDLIQNGFKSADTVWKIDTEVLVGKKIVGIVLHFLVDPHFPLDIPKIYLSQECYDELKYIPHVDSNRLVCTFDSEIAVTNPNDPVGVALESISRAKNIITDGLSGLNLKDFEDEFIAYWECRYNKFDQIHENVLSLIDFVLPDEQIKVICCKFELYGYKYILHKNDLVAKRFISFLNEYGVTYTEENIYLIQNSEFLSRPPFQLTNDDILTKFIGTPETSEFKEFKKFINSNSVVKLVLFSKTIGDKNYLLGWFHKPLNTNVKGFRPGVFKPFDAFQKTQALNLVERISPEILTPDRLSIRTLGRKNDSKIVFTLAGLGSIGSNIMFFLNSFPNSDFRLIDKDYLKVENISRHFLGLNYNKTYKTNALKDYYLKKNPIQDIQTKNESIIEVVRKDPDFINSANYLIVSIGKRNIENWIGEAIKDHKITIPTFFLWVEPYLSAGHCLYIPVSKPNYHEYFNDGLFKFNIISNSEYNTGAKLSLREAGCQTTYTPYSYNNLMIYLSNIFLKMHKTIIEKKECSCSFTWIGDQSALMELKVQTSEFAENRKVGEVITNEL